MSTRIAMNVAAGIVALSIAAGPPATAQEWWWPPYCGSMPAEPSSDDVITFWAWGAWPDTCVPNASDLYLAGDDTIQFELLWGYWPGTVCLMMITYWQLDDELGPLPAGTYPVYVTLVDILGFPLLGPTWVRTITVHESLILLGDTNCDGQTDFGDINPFVLALSNAGQYAIMYPDCPLANADINTDGTVDFADINPFVQLLTSPAPNLSGYWDDDCAGGQGRGRACDPDVVELTVVGHTLNVEHSSATYNCCADEIAVTLTVQGNVLHLEETEIAPDPCWCLCCHTVGATVSDLASGTYVVELCWYDNETGGELCHIEEIVVP